MSAFLRCDAGEPLFRLYTLLVAVELALKDHTGVFSDRHDLEALASHLPPSSAMQAVLNALGRSLEKLSCTRKTGQPAPMKAGVYPDLRYVRLARDGFANGSLDADVAQALADANQLLAELRAAKVNL